MNQTLRRLIASQTDFSMNLTNHISTNQSPTAANVVISALSIHLLLSLIATGSNGKTLYQIITFLQLPSSSKQDLTDLASEIINVVLANRSSPTAPRISFANGVWFDKSFPINPSFKQVAARSYQSQIQDVDFQNMVRFLILPLINLLDFA
ncbi:hypothetical protein ZOSMA_15G01720 [Zostera marina]|uniref:Serpin domain-containing protein n=1 Tax=Zostera marina TaxID=29655 RepID=A0A0K9PX59_ZOSMR|nr:hypothetical protein ZOSMA_15G01720 [Zostera marina]